MKKNTLKKALALLIAIAIPASVTTAFAGSVKIDTDIEMVDATELLDEWKEDQDYVLADPAPWDLDELLQVVDITDPRSVAAYYVWSVVRLVDNYDDGMEMMKYLFADIEPFGRGFTEGGMSGKAGWDTYFNERLKDKDYKWLPRAYFEGAESSNGFAPTRPLTLELYYNNTNTETINAQTLDQLGRLNIVYWVKSHGAGNQVNITVSKFDEDDRWYVTSGTTPSALFYDQRAALTNSARKIMETLANDPSTEAEHKAFYGGSTSGDSGDITDIADITDIGSTGDSGDEDCPQFAKFEDAVPTGHYAHDAIDWAITSNVTSGVDASHFGPDASCTRGQVVTFLWRAAGCPEARSTYNPFTDVKSSDYYYTPILWAVEKGITSGTSDTTFSPDEKCSSAHIITFLYRAMGIGSNGWYQEAKSWGDESGLLFGTGLKVDPSELCPRAAVVTFLYRFYN